MQLQDCINFILTYAQNSVFLFFRKELQSLGVTPIQYATLKCLWDAEESTPSELARILGLDTSTVTGILGRLEEKNLIVRDFCVTDRRRVTVRLTPEGRLLQGPVEQIIAKANEISTDGLSAQELASLKRNLHRIAENANRNL